MKVVVVLCSQIQSCLPQQSTINSERVRIRLKMRRLCRQERLILEINYIITELYFI